MLNRRRSYSRTFICIAATLLLIFGHNNYVFAEGKADEHKDPPVSTETHPIQTSTDENQVEMKATKTRQNESQAAAVATRSNETTRVLSIFLVNDLQYDIFPVHPENGSMCDMDTEAEKCVGGLPSLQTLKDDPARANLTNSIWLNAGNTLGGDLFRTLRFETAIRAMNLINFSAIAVGPSVFKFGGDAGRRYLDGLKQSIVVSNIDPAPQHKSLIFSAGNCSVLVIGYLGNTEQDQHVRGVSIKNYTQSILEEVRRIRQAQRNVSNLITVVIGSSSVNESRILASNETIDIVLFSGANWSAEAETNRRQNVSQFFWEPVSRRSSNRMAYVGGLRVNRSDMASRFMVGLIELPITNNCTVANASFKVLNYNTTTLNNTALDLIKLELEVLQRQNESLTQNPKNLTAERDLCRNSECSVGNLITDAMVAATKGDNIWGGNATSIGIFPAVDLQPNATIPEGSVTVTNLFGLIDQDAYIYSVLLTGRQLKDILEVSINSNSNPNSTEFLHVSRLLQIQYRKDHDNKSQIVSVKTVSAVSSSMRLSEIDVNDSATFYNVSVPLTLLKMDGYKKVLSAVNASFHPVTIVEAVTKYINNTRALSLPVLGSRFILLEPTPAPLPPVRFVGSNRNTVAVILVVAALIVCLIFGVCWCVFGRNRPGSDTESVTKRSSGNTFSQTGNVLSQYLHMASLKPSLLTSNMIHEPPKTRFMITEHGTQPKY